MFSSARVSGDSQSMPASSHKTASGALTVAALGVVFGDIGTSPLYAFKQCFTSTHGVPVSEANVFGILSLIFWSLILVISLKYVVLMLRADNRGEGGVLALSTLVGNSTRNWRMWTPISAIGILGAALFLGDGVLTPAISVLSAVEGLTIAAPQFGSWVIPITLGILIALFAAQRSGTEKIGGVFGPIVIIWFLTLGVLGLMNVAAAPGVLKSLNPWYAAQFFASNGLQGFLVLSAVFLCVTGGEALYADMGHFGRAPIRNAWFRLVLPSLVLNYLGQGALLLTDPRAIRNPFYLLAPDWFLIPLVALATAATIIASQAVISGVFSVTTQAMNLGYLPRLRVLQSSASSIGQVYVPTANWLLLVGTVLLVVGFRSSDALAGAYGIAVSATMLLAGILLVLAPSVLQGAPRRLVMPVLIAVCLIDLAFFIANITRILEAGWVPIALAAVVFLVMSTWSEGRRLLNGALTRRQVSRADFIRMLADAPAIERAAGTAVYLTNPASAIPLPLIQQLQFHRFLHERVIILTFARTDVPRLSNEERIQCETLAPGLLAITARYGFMERPNTLSALRAAEQLGVPFDPDSTYYVVGRTTPLVTSQRGPWTWRNRFYALMARNTRVGYEFFGVPTHRLLEIGQQVEL